MASSTCPGCTISPGRAPTCVTTPPRGMLQWPGVGHLRDDGAGSDTRARARATARLPSPRDDRPPGRAGRRCARNRERSRHSAARWARWRPARAGSTLMPSCSHFRRVDADDHAMAVGGDANRGDDRLLALHLALPLFLPLPVGEDQGPREQREERLHRRASGSVSWGSLLNHERGRGQQQWIGQAGHFRGPDAGHALELASGDGAAEARGLQRRLGVGDGKGEAHRLELAGLATLIGGAAGAFARPKRVDQLLRRIEQLRPWRGTASTRPRPGSAPPAGPDSTELATWFRRAIASPMGPLFLLSRRFGSASAAIQRCSPWSQE